MEKPWQLLGLNISSFPFASLPCDYIVKKYLKTVCGDVSTNLAPGTRQQDCRQGQVQPGLHMEILSQKQCFETIC